MNWQCFCVGLTLPQASAMVSNTCSKRNPGLWYGFRRGPESGVERGLSLLTAWLMRTRFPLLNILGRNIVNPENRFASTGNA